MPTTSFQEVYIFTQINQTTILIKIQWLVKNSAKYLQITALLNTDQSKHDSEKPQLNIKTNISEVKKDEFVENRRNIKQKISKHNGQTDTGLGVIVSETRGVTNTTETFFCGPAVDVNDNFIVDKCGVVNDFYGSANERNNQINDNISTDYKVAIFAIIHQFGELNTEVADFASEA